MTRTAPTPPTIYPIADHDALAGEVVPAVSGLAKAGAGWIQVRAKELGERCRYELVRDACRAAARHGAAIWVDDRVDLAALLPVAGVHLGQDDLPPRAARAVVGPRVWIGASTHDEEQVRRAAVDDDVDVVAIGPVFPTSSKAEPDPVVGLELVRRARSWTAKPLIAIGGIGLDNVRGVLDAGADSAAVIGAVCRAGAAPGARLQGLFEAAREER